MGCDIHMTVERRTPAGTWVPMPIESYESRNYSLFGMLADVRNGRGFAGVDLGNRVVPISEPRGLPDDVSDEVRKDSDDWDVDGHSHSWFTLAELMAVDWDQKVTHRCWARRLRNVPARNGETDDEFAARLQSTANLLGGLPPAAYWNYETCGDSSEGQGPSGWRTIQWEESWSTATGGDWMAFLLRSYRAARDAAIAPDAVRIVFWFDN